MTDLTPETIAHLRELDAARTQGEWITKRYDYGKWRKGDVTLYDRRRGYVVRPGQHEGMFNEPADAEFIAAVANHMGALLDAVEERDEYRERFRNQMDAATDNLAKVSRLRAELAEARARIERVTALAAKWDEDRALYPTNSDARAVPAAVAVRLCTEELRAALAPATPTTGADS